MTQQHPITPPPGLVRHWSWFQGDTNPEALWFRIANEAAQWGADQELEACCKWLKTKHWIEPEFADELRTSRRPKLPSLKEQALIHFDSYAASFETSGGDSDLIRRALEQLND